jgi:hypothetical protein
MTRESPSGRRKLSRALVLCLVVAVAGGCLGSRGPTPATLEPVIAAEPAPPALPDRGERMVADLAGLALADRDALASELLPRIHQYDHALRLAGEAETGLWDDAVDLIEAGGDESSYTAYAERTLARGDPDPALRRQLQLYVDSRPLNVARKRLHEDRMLKAGVVANRLVAPLSRLALGGSLNPIYAIRSALASLLRLHSFPEATAHERQALRAYRDFLERHPESPEAEWVLDEVAHYQRKRAKQLHEKAMAVAERAFEAGRPEMALPHLERAERALPGREDTRELHRRATAASVQRRVWVRQSFRSGAARPVSADARALGAALLIEPMERVAALASRTDPESTVADDERAFIEALSMRVQGDERAFFAALAKMAERDPRTSAMARHANHVVHDRRQNPYAHYRSARARERQRTLSWLLLGRYARGIPERDLPRPAEWVLALPGIATTLLTTPIRLLQYPTARMRFGRDVVQAAESYLVRYPDGAHAEKLHRELEGRYAQRSQWSRALAHHEARSDSGPEQISEYRERSAERALEAASVGRRLDSRISIYRSVAVEYPDTDAGKRAASELDELLRETTPQEIRISREFLEEHPGLWQPGALGLRPELMDGEEENGELADEGVTLLGRRYVRIALSDADPVVVELSGESFARLIAALDEASYRRLRVDERELPEPDPARDLFFERARLGLLDEADLRPAASSAAVFEGSREKHGLARRRDSILPVEVVLQGDLEDFGFAAVPRLKLPPQPPDAFLYR